MAAQAETPTLQATDLPARKAGKTLGRPSKYSPAVAELILARLSDGELLTEICRTPGMPHRQTVHRWRMRYPAFHEEYARAREIGMESMSDDTLMIADDDTCDILPDGTPNGANVQRARLQVDTRKFMLGKLAPKVYGDRQTVEHTGRVEHAVTLSDRERMRRLATFMAEDAHAGALIDGTAEQVEEGQAGTASPAILPAVPAPMDEDQPGGIDEPRANDDEI